MTSTLPKVRVQGRYFYTENGRVRLFHPTFDAKGLVMSQDEHLY